MNEHIDVSGVAAEPAAQYGVDYYASHCGPIPYDRSHPHWLEFFGKIADEIIQVFRPRRVFDAGCAHGFLVESLWDRGCEAWGRDISDFAISKVRPDVQPYCSVGSLTDPIEGKYDLVICIEVLEHLTESDGMQALANMTAAADRVVFSSSPDDFTEPTHINVKSPIYWIKAFAKHQFAPLIEASLLSITPYALAFERREMRPSDEYLIASLQVVRGRIQMANDYNRLGAVTAQLAEAHAALEASRKAALKGDEIRRAAEDQSLALRQAVDDALTEQARLRADCDNLRRANDQLTRQCSDFDALSRANDELARKCIDYDALHQANDELARRCSDYNTLREANDELTRLRATYDATIHSTTWRLTAPLRTVMRLVPALARRRMRQVLQLIYWSATLQIRARLRDRRIARDRSKAVTLLDGRGAAQDFDADYYLRANPDVAAAGINPLAHYLSSGRAEGRHPNALMANVRTNFDADYYLRANPDVAAAGINPLAHYLSSGRVEGRHPNALVANLPADFDADYYLQAYPDVAAAGVDPVAHYLSSGQTEGRYPNALAASGMVEMRLSDLCNADHDEPSLCIVDDAFCISVLTPTFNTPTRYLRELFQTLRNQHYANWEWVIIDDGSSNPTTITVLREISDSDPRVRLTLNAKNGGISAASNAALAAARGTHAALVDHDDLVSRDAFSKIYEAWRASPTTHLFFTDECKLLPDGTIGQFWVKPDWSPAYLECTMSLGHLAVYQTEFLRGLGGFRSNYDGTQDYDLALRASLAGPLVQHLPIFAYVWRITPGSAAMNLSEKQYAIERQRKAVLNYARHKHPDAEVVPGWDLGYWRIVYPLPNPAPLLSYVIPTGGSSRLVRGERVDLVSNCIRSFEERAFYPEREYIVVHNGNLTAQQIDALETVPNVRLVHYDAPVFNFSEKLNLGVSKARGQFLCLLNDDVEAITLRGGEELVSYLSVNPQVGCIGPLCLHEDETIQQNGVVLLERAGPAHAGDRRPADFGGHQSNLRCRRESFCIGGAAMFISTNTYKLLGGFSVEFPLNYNDVDFCQRLRKQGRTSVIDPGVRVYHYEGATKVGTGHVEQELFFLKHPGISDPYFSRRFDQGDPNYVLNFTSSNRRRGFGPWLDRHIAQRAVALCPEGRPILSVCVSVYNQPKRLLEEMYRSVFMQTYTNFEVLILDNGSSNPQTLSWLKSARREGRAKFVRSDVNLGISGGNLKLLESMNGDFFVAVDADDFLSVDALQIMAQAIEQQPMKKIFYSDEYKSDMNSTRFRPFFKPDFDPILLMNCCYPAHLMAMNAAYLREIGSYTDDRTTWCHDYDTLTRALALDEEPVHVREAIYAWRINPGSTASAETSEKPETLESQRIALTRLLRARALEGIVSIEPNTIESSSGMWRLRALEPIPNVEVLSASDVWGEEGKGVGVLALLAEQSGAEWIAILSAPDKPATLLELSAPAWFDPKLVAVCGVLMGANGIVQWSGGMFLPKGHVFDPYAGQPFSAGGYHGQLWCQRCIDVAAPVNVLIRATALVRAARRFGVEDADSLMIMLGLDAQERGERIAVTPHVRAPLSPTSIAPLPMDRALLLTKVAALDNGSRWYDGRLETDTPYTMADW